jgi:hypothetical protein
MSPCSYQTLHSLGAFDAAIDTSTTKTSVMGVMSALGIELQFDFKVSPLLVAECCCSLLCTSASPFEPLFFISSRRMVQLLEMLRPAQPPAVACRNFPVCKLHEAGARRTKSGV